MAILKRLQTLPAIVLQTHHEPFIFMPT